MKRLLFNFAAAFSFVLLLGTATLWLAHAVRDTYSFGIFFRIALGRQVTVMAAQHVDARPFAGYTMEIERPVPVVRGPAHLTPEYLEWEKQFRKRDRHFEIAGFTFYRWTMVRSPQGYTELISYQYVAEVPFWFVCALAMPVPAVWLRRHLRKRRRASAGLCLRCGYDLRASPDRCPECGHPG